MGGRVCCCGEGCWNGVELVSAGKRAEGRKGPREEERYQKRNTKADRVWDQPDINILKERVGSTFTCAICGPFPNGI